MRNIILLGVVMFILIIALDLRTILASTTPDFVEYTSDNPFQSASNILDLAYPTEGFEQLTPAQMSQPELLVADTYTPLVSAATLSKHNEQLWRKFVTIRLGSYTQTTNNIRYPINPDVGDCIPTNFCYTYYANNAMYEDKDKTQILVNEESVESPSSKQNVSNTNPNDVRIGYFVTQTPRFF